MEEKEKSESQNEKTPEKETDIKVEKEEASIKSKKEEAKTEIEKETIPEEKEKIPEEKMELNNLVKLTEKIEEKEKIEEIEQKIEKLKEEEIKNIKLIPKQELIVVVIHNITPNVTEGHLKEIFAYYGEIKEVYIPINKESQLKKNYAFIEFTKKENAENALLYMDEGQIDGKVVHLEILSPKDFVEEK